MSGYTKFDSNACRLAANYYHNVSKHITLPNGNSVELEVLLFDTVLMVGNTDIYYDNGTVYERPLSELPGPLDPVAAAGQLEWLKARMSASTADYLWVGGHYPVWAIGQDGPTPIRELLRPLLNKYEAHYFNGHQHDLEHIVESNSKVNYISTGAGKFCCYSDKNLNTVPVGSIKFAMSGDGKLLHRICRQPSVLILCELQKRSFAEVSKSVPHRLSLVSSFLHVTRWCGVVGY